MEEVKVQKNEENLRVAVLTDHQGTETNVYKLESIDVMKVSTYWYLDPLTLLSANSNFLRISVEGGEVQAAWNRINFVSGKICQLDSFLAGNESGKEKSFQH